MTMLALKNISLSLAQRIKPIINNISYLINRGEFIILLGSNGSGKSTLLKLLTQQCAPSQGEIVFNNKPLPIINNKELSKHIAILTQQPDDSLFPSLTIYENYLLMKRHTLPTIIHQQQERIFLQNYLASYNAKLATKLDDITGKLSGGEKQALALAFCFLNPPSLLLLDEHTSALDPKASKDIMALTQQKVTEHHITCILTTHDLDIALQYGDRILMLHDGKIHKVIEKAEKAQLNRTQLVQYYL